MAFVSEAFLNKLEPFFTKTAKRWQNKPPPSRLPVLRPSLTLKPDEKFTRQIYLYETTVSGTSSVLIIVLAIAVPFACFWLLYPQLFSNSQFQRFFVHKLSQDGFYWVPIEIVFLFVFNYVLYLPRFYFWNRRAARLQANPAAEEEQMTAVVDPSVWPPPPIKR